MDRSGYPSDATLTDERRELAQAEFLEISANAEPPRAKSLPSVARLSLRPEARSLALGHAGVARSPRQRA